MLNVIYHTRGKRVQHAKSGRIKRDVATAFNVLTSGSAAMCKSNKSDKSGQGSVMQSIRLKTMMGYLCNHPVTKFPFQADILARPRT